MVVTPCWIGPRVQGTPLTTVAPPLPVVTGAVLPWHTSFSCPLGVSTSWLEVVVPPGPILQVNPLASVAPLPDAAFACWENIPSPMDDVAATIISSIVVFILYINLA